MIERVLRPFVMHWLSARDGRWEWPRLRDAGARFMPGPAAFAATLISIPSSRSTVSETSSSALHAPAALDREALSP